MPVPISQPSPPLCRRVVLGHGFGTRHRFRNPADRADRLTVCLRGLQYARVAVCSRFLPPTPALSVQRFRMNFQRQELSLYYSKSLNKELAPRLTARNEDKFIRGFRASTTIIRKKISQKFQEVSNSISLWAWRRYFKDEAPSKRSDGANAKYHE